MTPTRRVAWLGCAVALLASCSMKLSSDTDDPFGDNSLVSDLSAIALVASSSGWLCESDRSGHELVGRREIARDIARGSGPFVSDLADWLELPADLLPELGAALRDARPVLAPALSERITVESFGTLIGVALCRDPRLRYHAWKRFSCGDLAPLDAP